MKAWAASQNTGVSWVFTKTGLGKGPMDGLSWGIKRVVEDLISYNSNGVKKEYWAIVGISSWTGKHYHCHI